MTKAPSFDPWLRRVRLARALLAAVGAVLVTTLSHGEHAWDVSLARGLATAVVCYFIGWASALWICSELYGVEVARAQAELKAKLEEERRRHEEALAEAQAAVAASQDHAGGAPTFLTSGQRSAA